MAGIESQVNASALYVSLVREQCFEIADEFAEWWIDNGGRDCRGGHLRRAPLSIVETEALWDADELGIDEDDLWP